MSPRLPHRDVMHLIIEIFRLAYANDDNPFVNCLTDRQFIVNFTSEARL